MNPRHVPLSRTLTVERLERRDHLASTALPFVGMSAFNAQQPYPGVGLTVDGSHGPNNGRWSIAVIDTGVDLNHPYFVRQQVNNGVADRIVYHYNFYDGNDSANDTSETIGHGSGVAGIAAGYKASGAPGPFSGVAVGADIVALKVFPEEPSEMTEPGFQIAVNEALSWVLRNKGFI